MKNNLFLFSDSFPYGNEERTFILPELEWMKEVFDVTVISSVNTADSNQKVESPLLNKIHHINIVPPSLSVWQKTIYTLKSLFSIECWKEAYIIIGHKRKRLAQIREMIGVYACAGIFWKQLKEKNPDIIKENAIYYTFWLNYKTLALLLNRKKLKQAVIVSRIHGVDMFCERIPCEWHPFRRFMGNKLDNLIFVSNDGYNYYCERFMDGEKPDNFNICRLGVEQKNSMNPENRSGIFRLVSCSHIINIKRINLIIEALAILPKTKKIEWIHFGDGELTAEMKELACIKLTGKENISYEFRGYVPNKELLQFYRDTPVDCFITTSSTEGLPVSIEEALSFGIPIIGTDVGGISETINENGILLSSNPDIQEIGEAILKIYDEPINKIRKYRENSYKIWERDFNSEKNNKNLRILLEGKINHASDAYI